MILMEVELNLNYLDCIKDSPKFRKNINLSFSKIVDFQEVITEVSESFSQSVKSGLVFSCHYQTFCAKIEKLNKLYNDDDKFQHDLHRIIKIFVEFKEHFKSLMESFHFIQKDFKQFMDHFKDLESHKKTFQKASDNLDSWQQKSAACPKSKANECMDVDKQCSTAKYDFTQASLSYMTKLEKFEIHKHSLFLSACSGIIAKKSKYYGQGNEFMSKVDPWVEHLQASKAKYDISCEKKTKEISSVVQQLSSSKWKVGPATDGSKGPMEGYLYRCPRKSWQKWQRRWFKVDNNQLLSCKRTDESLAVIEHDLRICTAKELVDTDRRFCLELIGLDHSLLLQAEDEPLQKSWIDCFQNGLSSQMGTLKKNERPVLNNGGKAGPLDRKSSVAVVTAGSKSGKAGDDGGVKKSEDRKSNLLGSLMGVKGNSLCCDCNDDKPRWASSSLGITVCTECSGAHRSMGVHISKVRSLTLDNWEPEMLCVMFMLGNELVNCIYESDKDAIQRAAQSGVVKPDTNTDMNTRKLWTRAKWEKKQFVLGDVRKLLSIVEQYIRENMAMFSGGLQDGYPFTSTADLLRYGLELHCLPLMMLALAHNASPNGDDREDFIPIHLAASSDFWPGCEFLILNGAKIDIVDKNNQTSLHKACHNENVLVVWLLLKRGARQNIRDADDHEPLHIAMSTTNANTVTLLRLQMLNENTKEANLGSSGDETVNDVFRDFTNRAFDQIEEWFITDSGRFHRMSSSKSLTNNVLL